MTIVQLIEILCSLIEELTALVDQLSMRLMQAGCMTEGEAAQLKEIQRRIEAIGISPPRNDKKDTLNTDGVGS